MTEPELDLEEEAWLDAQHVDLIDGRAVALEPGAHRLTLSGGRELGYDICLLATGAEPTRLPVPGGDHPSVRTLRSLADLGALRLRLRPAARVAVIGSGFIGCEIAASLRTMGHPVALVSQERAPNVERLGERVAVTIRGWLEELGVSLMLDAAVERIEHGARGPRVLAGGGVAEAEVIVMATGVTPRSELAAMAGLQLAGSAVAVDSSLRTSAPGVMAAGDACAAVNATAQRRLRVEHWGDALSQGTVAGQVAAGGTVHWDDVPGFWSTIGERVIKFAAWGDGFTDTAFVPGADGAFTAWYGQDGRIVGVLTHDRDTDYEQGRELIARGAAWR